MELKTTTNSGSQQQTGTPQNAGQAGNSGAKAGQIQPGTATALLNRSEGVALQPRVLPSVPLPDPRTSTTVLKPVDPADSGVNPAAIAVPVFLFIVAIVLFWVASRPDKKYNK